MSAIPLPAPVSSLLLWLFVLLLALSACGGPEGSATGEVTILTGPRFWTGVPEEPWAEALLISNGRVEALLSASEIKQRIASGGTVKVLPGRLAVPGLVDAHAHILGYGLTLTRAHLVGTKSLEQCLERVRDFAKAHPGRGWLEGRGWDQNDWPNPAWPDADRLEQEIPSRPVALRRVDGHALWVNRSALAAAGIDDATPDPPGGRILRDQSGRATGILVDEAMDLVLRHLPSPSQERIESALIRAAHDLLAVGLTGVHDMGVDRSAWEAMKKLARKGRFPLRVHAYVSQSSDLFQELLETGPQYEGRLRLVGVKIYADGALGSRGARLLEPYSDERQTRGLWVHNPHQFVEVMEAAAAAGIQPAVHAIGDGACRAVLDAWEKAKKGHPKAPPLRLEHAQIMHPTDLPRVARLGVVASMQPTHATSDMLWAESRLGVSRLKGAYAWRAMLETGALLAFGSDFPVESIDPRKGLYAAITRQDARGLPPGGWYPEQRLTIEQALRAFTLGAAEAVGQGERLGTLMPGRAADVTVFDSDIFELSPVEILDVPITATVIGGSVYYPGRD